VIAKRNISLLFNEQSMEAYFSAISRKHSNCTETQLRGRHSSKCATLVTGTTIDQTAEAWARWQSYLEEAKQNEDSSVQILYL
jgi:hypothetical protein